MAFATDPLSTSGHGRKMVAMSGEQASVRAATVIGWAIVFGLAVDVWTEGPPGLGIVLAATLAAVGLILAARPRPRASMFLAAGLVLVSFVVVRDSPVLVGLDVLAAIGLFALAGAFAREGDPLRAGLRAYAARALAWTVSIPAAAALVLRPLIGLDPARRRPLVLLRALLIALPAGLAFALLLGSADAVFANLLRAPFQQVPFVDLPEHVLVVAGAGGAFLTLAVRASTPPGLAWTARPIQGGGLRPADWIALLATVDAVFALFVGVQLVAFFGGRRHVLAETGLTFAEYARSGFWQMVAAAALTGLVIAAAWIAGRPTAGRQRATFRVLASVLVGLTLVVLASAFSRLVLYETEFGYTWPRLIGHASILLTAALLASGLVAVLTGRTAWLPTATLGLAFLTLIGLNLLDPDAFIAERNISRVERGYDLDTWELASLSADAAPAIADAIPELDPSIRPQVERDLSCLRAALRRDADRFGWTSFNVARDVALERLNTLALPGC
jgi:hypothetical protein